MPSYSAVSDALVNVRMVFLGSKKVRAALGEGRPRAYRSGDGVGVGT
jgi:hypothetical protein